MKNEAENMQNTGERFMPEDQGDIALEHLHRYLQACELVSGKVVLDIASGEGYGSAMLANSADRVIGVDISTKVVEYARRRYQKENLEYLAGGCAEIPLPDASIDLVVSFETIEHHDQHEKMMEEIKRVLRPDGMLLISSPDKYHFSDKCGHVNPFHVKELYESEFKELLKNYFSNIAYFGQRIVYGSGIFAESLATPVLSYWKEQDVIRTASGSIDPVYWIALASDTQLPELASGLLAQPTDESQIVRHLNGVVVERDRRIAEQDRQIAERDRQIAEQDRQISSHVAVCAALYASTSWRVTKPLRQIGLQLQLLRQLRRLFSQRVRQSGGFKGAAAKLLDTFRCKGPSGIWQKIRHLQRDAYCEVNGGSRLNINDYNEWIRCYDTVTDESRLTMQSRIDAFVRRPLISIIMPVYNPGPEWLIEAVESVRAQIYPHWELCIADDASTDPAIRPILEKYAGEDRRIKVVFRSINGHISAASNSAIDLVSGEYVALLDHDDLLSEHALFCMAEAIDTNPRAQFIYSDEDKLSENGQRVRPFFKPDWSPHLAVSQAYIGHLTCIHALLLKELGGFDEKLNGAQDYDLWLRAALVAREIIHVPRVLYHWRMHESSTAQSCASKPYAHEVGRLAVERYLKHRYPQNSVVASCGDFLFTYKAEFELPADLLVSIIIPTLDNLALLQSCIDSITSRSTYKRFEIIILDNGSKEDETLRYLENVQVRDKRIRVIRADIPFNWSRLNNIGAREAKGDILIFLNNDTKVISTNWLESLAGFALLPDTGVVGGLLLFKDGTIQHSGVVVGMGGWAEHVFRMTQPIHTCGQMPFVSPVLTRNVLAVTGACMAISREKFYQLGTFDESFIICGSDVELGLRAHRHGYFNVMCAEAKLYHYEAKSRTPYIPEEDFARSDSKYAPYRLQKTDPYYNPNLSLGQTTPCLKKGRSQDA